MRSKSKQDYHLLRSIWWFVPLAVMLIVLHMISSENLFTCNSVPVIGHGDCAGPWLFVLIYPIAGVIKLASFLLAAVGVVVIIAKWHKIQRVK